MRAYGGRRCDAGRRQAHQNRWRPVAGDGGLGVQVLAAMRGRGTRASAFLAWPRLAPPSGGLLVRLPAVSLAHPSAVFGLLPTPAAQSA